jgi:tRNA (guanine37-N1)-methyltransferase
MIARAQKAGKLSISCINPREYSEEKHKQVDDKSYGGGPGMVIQAEPVLRAVDANVKKGKKVKYVVFSPSGKKFTQSIAHQWAKAYNDIVLICGRYEGVDDRVRQALDAEEISIGDYVLTGGELPALVVLDAIARHIPGFLGKEESQEEKRVASPRVFTRPEVFSWKRKKYAVPRVLVEGNHKKIEEWRKGSM